MKSRIIKAIVATSLLLVLSLVTAFAIGDTDSYAAGKVKLSKTKLTFASPTAKSQTITIKNIKKSNIKSVQITNYPERWVSVKKKGKNQIVVTPKLSSSDNIGGIDLIVEFKKPVKKAYRAYLSISKIKINGSSEIPIKTADDFFKMNGNCVDNRWTYYLANDIDLAGKGYWNDRSGNNNLVFDGRGHKIISDGPAFDNFFGEMKNVVFDCRYDMAVSKDDKASALLKDAYFTVAPVETLETSSTMTNCKSIGSIKINLDANPGGSYNHSVAGLVGDISYSAKVSRSKSEVDINVNVSESAGIHGLYIGGLANENSNGAVISECEFSGSIYTNYRWPFLAGLCQYNEQAGRITNCMNSGSVKSETPYDYTAGICVNGGESTKPDTGIDRVLNVGDVRAALFGGIRDQSDIEYKQFPTFAYAYYLKSKSDAVIYREGPISIPGTIGITDSELLKQETFEGFDFENVWKMGANGPELRNLP